MVFGVSHPPAPGQVSDEASVEAGQHSRACVFLTLCFLSGTGWVGALLPLALASAKAGPGVDRGPAPQSAGRELGWGPADGNVRGPRGTKESGKQAETGTRVSALSWKPGFFSRLTRVR